MVKNIYYRKTNFSNKQFSELFKGQLIDELFEQNLKKNKIVDEIDALKQECIEQMNLELQTLPEGKNKKLLMNFSHDFYNERGNYETKFHKIYPLLSKKLSDRFSYFFYLNHEIKNIESCINEKVKEQYYFEKSLIIKSLLNNFDFVENTKMTDDFLYLKVKKLLDTDITKHNKKQKNLDGFLYNYYTRIAAKTSPLGLLGVTGLSSNKTSVNGGIHMSVNSSVILKIFDHIYLNQKYQSYLSFKLNETLIEKDNKYYVTIFSDITGKTIYRNRQELVTITKNPFIDGVIMLFQNNRILKGKDILKFLSIPEGSKYLIALIKNQIILPSETLKICHKTRISNALLDFLEKVSPSLFADEIEVLDKIINLEEAEFSWESYDTLVDIIDLEVKNKKIDGFKRSNLVFIDSLEQGKALNIDKEIKVIEEEREQLSDLSKFVSIFDISVRNKYLAYKFLEKKYNSIFIPKNSKEISKFLRDLSETIFHRDGYWMEAFGYLGGKYVNDIDCRLLEIKMKIIKQLLSQILINDEPIFITKDLFKDSVKKLELLVGHTHNSRSHFIQIGSGNEIIFNHIYKGYGVYRRRFSHYLDTQKEDYGLDGELVDIPMTFGFNANIRESTDKALTLPLGDNTLYSKTKLSWLDIGYRTSNISKEIEMFELSTGNIVYPHFLGSLITAALPSLVASFNSITLNDSLYCDFGEIILRELIKQKKEAMIVVPRIYFIDRKMLLSRKKWYINCDYINDIISDSSVISYKWMKIVQYFSEKNIPTQFFIKDFFETYTEDSDVIKNKPLYINFNSLLSFKSFMNRVKNKQYMLLEEEFPSVIENNSENITELIYETND